jgi:hypothetical protein
MLFHVVNIASKDPTAGVPGMDDWTGGSSRNKKTNKRRIKRTLKRRKSKRSRFCVENR